MSQKNNRKKNTLNLFSKRKLRKTGFLKGFGMVLTLSLVFLYIFQVTEMTKEIHLMRDYDRRARSILEENRKNEYSFLNANSSVRAEDLINGSEFVRVGEISYISISSHQVALR